MIQSKSFAPAVLAIAGLTGCAQVSVSQMASIDDKTRVAAHLEGGGLRASLHTTNEHAPLHREILDADGKVLFAYDLDLSKGAADGSYLFRLKPSAQKPTFAAVREVALKSRDESVRVELMENPATGQKVSDILRVEPRTQADLQATSHMAQVMRIHNMIFNYFHGK